MNQCAVCCSKQFGPNGCQVPVLTDSGSATTCGETQTLDILREIRNEFDNKMRQIEDEAGGDCYLGLQAKLHLQQEWIRSLTVQNEMLVDAVKELEIEASNRVLKLEEKLENSAQIGSEVMQKYRNFTYSINLDETFQKLEYLRSDIKNLLEFIRRIRIDGRWNIEGLQFYDVTYQDLFGSCACNVGCVDPSLDMEKVERKFKVKFEIIENVNGVTTKCPINTENLLIQYPQESNQNTFCFRYSPD